MNDSLKSKFVQIVGEKYAIRDLEDMAPYTKDWRGRYTTQAAMVLQPKNAEEISQIMKLACETKTAIIPQAGNTGLVGAGIGLEGGNGEEIILSVSRLNSILEVDADSNTMTVEAGAVLETLQNAADDVDRLFPLSLGSQGTCQIGGNIGSNAGGTGVLAYGNTRQLVMGLEVVLPTGEIWNGLSRLRKDNTGYDLKNLMIGAEGTLGVITKAVVKLFPKPKGREVAFIAVNSTQAALDLLNLAKGSVGNGLTAFEFMAEIGMAFTLRHSQNGTRAPIEGNYPWYILMEISSGRSTDDARTSMEGILEAAFEAGIVQNATIAESLSQQNAFWQLREDMSDAQKPEGASIKHDIAVPVGSLPKFIAEADTEVLKIVPDARIVNFGHMGDGNLHYNISQPVGWDREKFFAFEPVINNAVYDLIAKYHGSISAEHGIGQMKREKLAKIKDPTALFMMRKIKTALDPEGIMNPGKVL